MQHIRGLSITALLVVLTACGGQPAASPLPLPPTPTLPTRPPSVTPIPRVTSTSVLQRTPPPTHAPPTSVATAVRASTAITITDAGPVNRWLAALDLSGERYAALGDPAAPITIIEFADHGCPYCRFFALNTFPELRMRYIETGKVYYVYKDLPVVSARGDLAAQAALCAGEQGDYWGMHHQLAIDTEDWNIGADGARAAFRRYAHTLQLDIDALDRCVVSEQYAPEVQLDTDSALRLGIRSTPIFIINDKVLIGTRPFETFDAILSAMLGS